MTLVLVFRLFDYIEHKNNHDIETLEQLELDSETGRYKVDNFSLQATSKALCVSMDLFFVVY